MCVCLNIDHVCIARFQMVATFQTTMSYFDFSSNCLQMRHQYLNNNQTESVAHHWAWRDTAFHHQNLERHRCIVPSSREYLPAIAKRDGAASTKPGTKGEGHTNRQSQSLDRTLLRKMLSS